MSLILDALKKSDAERSRHRAPEAAAGLRPVGPRRSSRWTIPIVILLALNALGIAWLVSKSSGGNPQPPAAATAEPAVVPDNRSPAAASARSTPTQTAQRAPVESLAAQVAETPREQPTAPASTNLPANESTTGPARRTPTTNPVVQQSYPTYTRYTLDSGNTFGTLAVSLHVYDADPARRFAFVDGQKVSEGSRLGQDLSVAQITPEGVVFAYGSDRFLVPRD